MNRLYYGDCLSIMRSEMTLSSVDLIYLDPPFSSNRNYNAIYRDEAGRVLPDQVETFCDTWKLDTECERAIQEMPVLMREVGINDEIIAQNATSFIGVSVLHGSAFAADARYSKTHGEHLSTL